MCVKVLLFTKYYDIYVIMATLHTIPHAPFFPIEYLNLAENPGARHISTTPLHWLLDQYNRAEGDFVNGIYIPDLEGARDKHTTNQPKGGSIQPIPNGALYVGDNGSELQVGSPDRNEALFVVLDGIRKGGRKPRCPAAFTVVNNPKSPVTVIKTLLLGELSPEQVRAADALSETRIGV